MLQTERPPIPVSNRQDALLREYGRLLVDINRRFNLISRSDVLHVLQHHIYHCLSIARFSIPAGSRIVDWGSGGGLPAIPLAIMWPEVQILAVDSNANKTRSIDLFCRKLGLDNCATWHGRAEKASGVFQYSVSRATASLKELWKWHTRVFQPKHGKEDGSWVEGLICLKGGNLTAEISELSRWDPATDIKVMPVTILADDPYFSEKWLVHVTFDSE